MRPAEPPSCLCCTCADAQLLAHAAQQCSTIHPPPALPRQLLGALEVEEQELAAGASPRAGTAAGAAGSSPAGAEAALPPGLAAASDAVVRALAAQGE